MKTALDKVFRSWIFQNVELINEINYERLNWTIFSNTVLPEPGGQVGHFPPSIFGRSVTLFQLGEGRLSPPITTGTPEFFSTSGITET
jgi:hypothetical protein